MTPTRTLHDILQESLHPLFPENMGKRWSYASVFVMGSGRHVVWVRSAFLTEVSEFCATTAEKGRKPVRAAMVETIKSLDRRSVVPNSFIATHPHRLRSPRETAGIEYGRPHCPYLWRPHPDSHPRGCLTTNFTELFKPTPSNILSGDCLIQKKVQMRNPKGGPAI